MAEPLPIRMLTVDDYHAMAEAGILHEDDHVELIDGQLVKKMTIGHRHIRAVNYLNEAAIRRASDVVEVSIQNPVRLSRFTEPEPDVVLLKRGRNLERIPHAEDVLLLVEVAEGSLRFDRRIKLPRYAAAGVPEVWIVNLVDDCIESYREPSASGYSERAVCSADEPANAMLVPQLGGISIRDIFES